ICLEGFVDYEMASDIDRRKSTSSFIFTLGNGAVKGYLEGWSEDIGLPRNPGDEKRDLGFSRIQMDETELEEGEASYYQDDPNIDPDVALSYLDEKVQFVLGHFQKDFEGGCSAENLGAKFGGYGSFLPTYQRSPAIWSHPKTSPKAQGNIPQSPNSLPFEASRQNSTLSSSGAAHVSRVPLADSTLYKRDYPLESTSKHKPVNNTISSTDQKTLKVRIKVGSENMAQTNAEIYSGLGLDFSPSSSMENSPIGSGGLSPKSRDFPEESPTSILHIMTSNPIPGSFLLSPLPDGLLHFCEMERSTGEHRTGLTYRGSQESTPMLVDHPSSLRKEDEVIGEKKIKSVEKNGRMSMNEASSLLRKEIDTETSSSMEVVCAPKIPLPSNLKCTIIETTKVSGRTSDISSKVKKGMMADDIFSSDLGKDKNIKTSSADKDLEDKKASSHKDGPFVPKKDGRSKGEKKYEPFKFDLNGFKGTKDLNAGVVDSSDKRDSVKCRFHQQDGAETPNEKEQLMFEGKSKIKGNQSNGSPATEFAKEILRAGSSSVSKDKRKSSGDYSPKNNNKKESGKSKGIHRDTHGDAKLEETESWKGTPLKERPKISNKLEAIERVTHKFADKSKESSNCKKATDSFISEEYPKADQIVAPSTGVGPFGEAIFPTETPLVIKEDWVSCDRCKKWRLLPFGSDPNTLPKKWLCSMINWLPGMNRCTISEDDTTKALYALFNLPVPESQNDQHTQHNQPDEAAYLSDLHGMPSEGKKKHGSRETPNVATQTGPTNISNSTKKNQQASIKSSSSNGVTEIPFESIAGSKSGFHALAKSSDSVSGKNRRRQKEQHKVADEGDAKHITMKTKRVSDQDGHRAFKKSKIFGVHSEDEGWTADHGGIKGKLGTGLPVSGNKLENAVKVSLDGRALHIEKDDQMGIVATKKRVKEWQESPKFPHHHEVNRVSLKEETSESELRKEKKARLSKSEGKEIDSGIDKRARGTRILLSASRDIVADGLEDGRGYIEKEQKVGQYQEEKLMSQRMLDGIDILKQDLGYEEVSVAAASSSSKVSGSRKSKYNSQEIKGSPVESVSSSPLRYSNSDKVKPVRRILLGNNDVTDAGFSVVGSLKRCSDGDRTGGSDHDFSGTVKEDKNSSVFPRGSLESAVLDNQDSVIRCKPLFGKAKSHDEPPRGERENIHMMKGESRAVDHHNSQYQESQGKKHNHDEARLKNNLCHSNGPVPRKSGKGSSSRSKEKQRSSKSDNAKGKIKENRSLTGQSEPYSLKPRGRSPFLDEKYNIQKTYAKSSTDEKSYSGRREKQSKSVGGDGSDVKFNASCSEGKPNSQHNVLLDHEGERSSHHFLPETSSDRGKSKLFSDSGDKQESRTQIPRPVPVNGSGGSNSATVKKQSRKLDNQDEPHNSSLQHSTPNGVVADLDAPSPLKRDSSIQAGSNALKEAKGLKHTADRMKNSGLGLESTGLYFQAALKFLHGASLLESSNVESVKNGETQSMQVYGDTAKLCAKGEKPQRSVDGLHELLNSYDPFMVFIASTGSVPKENNMSNGSIDTQISVPAW
ncbi:hypothetical protein GIB67_042181, partial [Kingdonia uniflora]